MPQLIILVGNIGSGKSTLVQEYIKKGYIVISRDSLRYGIGGGQYKFDYDLEPVIWETELTMFKLFLLLGKNIIIDEVGISKLMRKRYLDIVRLPFYPNYSVICIEMPKLSRKEAIDRRMKDPHGQPDRQIWEDVWEKFNNQYETPTKEEGFNKIIRKI